MPSRAFARCETQLKEAEYFGSSITAIQGRRSLNHLVFSAGLVKAVAAWDGYLNDVIIEALARIRQGGPTHYTQLQLLHEDNVTRDLIRFNTPNTQNVRSQFKSSLNCDPCSSWARPKAKKSAHQIGEQLDSILRVRHSIAHGFPMKAEGWNQSPDGTIRLDKKSLRWSISLIKHVAETTDKHVSSHIYSHFGLNKPW